MSRRRRAVVTGAASGIGEATAHALGQAGYDLAIGDIDEKALTAVAEDLASKGIGVTAQTVDVADRAAMKAWAEGLHENGGAFDVVVNNAGVALTGAFDEVSLDDWVWLLDINLMGVVHGCHFFLPPMIDRGRGGHVVNISSVAGLVGFRQMSAYNAAKFAVRGLSASLRWELAEHGIGVTAICPGTVATNIVKRGRLRGFDGLVAERVRGAWERRFASRGIEPAAVAEQILASVKTSGGVRLVGTEAKVIRILDAFAPGVLRWIAERQYTRTVSEAERSAAAEVTGA